MYTPAAPPVTPEVIRWIEHLDSIYPARCILRDEPLTEAHRYAGARDVVEYMRAIKAREEGPAQKVLPNVHSQSPEGSAGR